MVEEAEKYKNEDAEVRERIDAKNRMEEQIYSAKKATDSLNDDDKNTAARILKVYEDWHTNHPSESKEDYEAQSKKMMEELAPLMSKPPADDVKKPPVPTDDGPAIEEID